MATDVQAPLPSLGDYRRLLHAAESMLRFFEMRTVHPFFNKYDAITEMLAWENLQQIQAHCFSSYSGTLEAEHHQPQWWACNAFKAIAEPIQSCSIEGHPLAFVPSPDELGRIRISISGFKAAIESLTEAAQAPMSDQPDGTDVPFELPRLVTLDQAAALVERSARTLERYKKRGLPRPYVLGGGRKPHEYLYQEMREWLQKTFKRPIPEVAILRFRHPKTM